MKETYNMLNIELTKKFPELKYMHKNLTDENENLDFNYLSGFIKYLNDCISNKKQEECEKIFEFIEALVSSKDKKILYIVRIKIIHELFRVCQIDKNAMKFIGKNTQTVLKEIEDEKMRIDMNKQEKKTLKTITNEFAETFPEWKTELYEHINSYEALLGHIFYYDTIVTTLEKLLEEDVETEKIIQYCNFIEKMWETGDYEVENIVDVTIIEDIAFNSQAWHNISKYFSKKFIKYINEILINENIAMLYVDKLEIKEDNIDND